MDVRSALNALVEADRDSKMAQADERVAAVPVSAALQKRVEVLAAKANEGELTDEERAEYEGIIKATDYIAMVKHGARHGARARKVS